MTATAFRDLLETMFRIEYDDEEFKILFLKINSSRTGEITWDELVSHLILCYFSNDPENQRGSLHLPILGRPNILNSKHKHRISRICFCPEVTQDRSIDPMQGSYITASRDGLINWWTLDMKLKRSACSSSLQLKVHSTWVTDMVCMPDVNIIAISSTERDLRFYDCIANTFVLKIVITSWEHMARFLIICTMSYYFHPEDKEQCKLICGDVGGNLRLLLFSADMRGPFRGDALLTSKKLRHVDLQKTPHVLPGLRLEEMEQVHAGWVRQVGYYASLHSVLSCATSPDSLFMCDTHGAMECKMFRVEKGIRCFAFDDEAHVMVTGGPDRVVRVWNPFVTTKPNLTFHGHQAGVIWIVLQNKGQTIYSLARNRTIKVWDVKSQTCRQTYNDIPSVIDKAAPITAVYNHVTRQFILAAYKIAVLLLDEQLNPLHTDGFTHATRVSKVLYNPLFKVIITCGMDSIVINWNPVSGQRNLMIREAHTRVLHGQVIPVEITAACFDPGHLLLLTGARSGELKVWNFNTGACMRVMSIEHMCEVTNCFWIEGRILAVGWNRHVVEFEDCCMSSTGKSWETRHTDDVLAAAVRHPLTLATATYNSELVMWRLETGQPYRRFSCAEPTAFFKENYVFAGVDPGGTLSCKRGICRRGPFASSTIRKPSTAAADNVLDPEAAIRKAAMRCLSSTAVNTPSCAHIVYQLAAQAMIFLQTRPQHVCVASLFLALDSGHVQCWSDHATGGFLGSFHAVHRNNDYVTSLASDVDNEFLFTGSLKGYVKVWLMTNFLDNRQVHINMPRLRLMFPFLWRDRIVGRAKRTVRKQPLPMLLNSYRAHMRSVTTIAYIDELKLLLTGSADYSVRLWRLSGEYLQTLGSFVPWTLDVTRFPPDVKKVASFTTLKVWRGGEVSRFVSQKKESDKLHDVTEDELQHKTFGERPAEPLLGKHRSLPPRPDEQDSIKLNVSLPKISLYKHLRLAATVPVRRPPTPELLRNKLLRERPKKMHFDESALPVHRAQSTYSRQSEQVRQSTYSNYSTYSRQSAQPRSSAYSSQSRPSAYSTLSRPSAYSTLSRPSTYSTLSRPSTYFRLSTYSKQSRRSTYSPRFELNSTLDEEETYS
ncbi:hypothetical protein PYW07_002514 [Mythimna separata]|uniref:WD repeat-containing protein on Y chromosome n=1 Tax=Mythimna separata TaxID=271217 RepID=A0AAD7YPB4_MYTSE|nr:hypothetical protein PYW07_002514 [Mythimna separata]